MKKILMILVSIMSVTALACNNSKSSGNSGPSKESITTVSSDIVDTAASAGQFNTLLAAATAAGLVDTLKSDGPFTVFAPTDEAFSKLGAETINELLKPENKDQLTQILLYHVVPAKVVAEEAVKLSTAPTVNGKELMLEVNEGSLFINSSKVIATDVFATNGVIHVIDSVLIP